MSELVLEKRNELPKQWVGVSLGDVIIPIKGKKPKTLGKQSITLSIPYIDIKSFEKQEFTNFTDEKTCPKCSKDDVLIVWDGSRSGLVGTGVSGAIGSTLSKLFCFDIFPKYLYYFLQMHYKKLNKNPKGIGIPHVNPNILWSLNFPLPPLNEQKRIVKKIEELLSRLESITSTIIKIKTQLQIFHNSILISILEGKIISVSDNSTQNIIDEIKNIRHLIYEEEKAKTKKKIPVPPEPITFDDHLMYSCPPNWQWTTLNSIIDPIRGITYGVIKLGKEVENGIPCLRTSDVKLLKINFENVKKISKKISDQYTRTILQGGEVLVNVRGTLGGVCSTTKFLKGYNVSREIAVIPVLPIIPPDWVSFWISSISSQNWLENETKGIAYRGINLEDLRNLPICIPPLESINNFVDEIKKQFFLSEKINEIMELENSVKSLRVAIINYAFEGKLVPQDPNDESAEILLEKIKQEKEHLIQKQKISKRKKNVK